MIGCRTLLIAFLGCLVLPPLAALAQTAVFSAQTGASTLFPCPSFCGGPGSRFQNDSDGGIGMTASTSSLNNIDGLANALASLDGPTELPILRAEAFSQSNSSAVAQAFGMQGFYVDAPEYSLDLTISGIALNDPAPGSNADGSVVANVMIFRDNDPSSDVFPTSHYATMKFEVIPLSGDLELLADAVEGPGLPTLTIPADNVTHSVSTTLTVTDLNVNDLIYVWANVIASGTRSGFGDAFDTLTMEFQNPQGLSHSPHPTIPEPASAILTLLGTVGFVAGHRLNEASRHSLPSRKCHR
jgi:hypothetical protein